ncbi:MAG: isochorismatase family protein [Hydrogenophaga sp.]|uniref:cysteine hydrolase family protein n=1 Tax=Hydrogenophaga sp. TaxID=1904254 RepID=UPI0016917850|nr:isochorismatase family cysteine hydrolase [Hydrogenophaga sp.]NIM43218.1 isochorismatase family protein [Hydrogenophaga sp.]NIN28286.1 isochorismatase family protein [Hydrogenophaga sp.]NIN29105.1 isochorismatase family protein [Hydrogenophaga sp.]NIN57421.1 isochorismatase family protein [Hydrogenophaga sp.]NIO53716.1 isochorismatase family protein [Hydrogenophaga sp.]
MGEADLVKSRRALLLIDFINPLDFPEAGALAEPALAAARASRHLAQAARSCGIPVIYANDNFGRWQSDFPTMVKRLGQGRDVSASIVRLLRPRRGDLTVLKPMHSAFFGTPLDIILDQTGARSVVLAGLATDICIQLTAADAFLRGLKVHVPEDCTAAESPQKKAIALAYMRDILKCDTRPWRSLRWHRDRGTPGT